MIVYLSRRSLLALFGSPEPNAPGELIGWDSSQSPSVHIFKHEYL